MTTPQNKVATAQLDVALWQAEADLTSSSDLYVRLTSLGLSPEIAIRLRDLIDVVRSVGGRVVSIGKIIVLKLIDFVEKHPNLAVGMALGAGVAALVGAVPILGPLLAALTVPLGAVAGAVIGHRMDRAQGQRISVDLNPISISEDLIEIARAFFRLFTETLSLIADQLA